VVGTLMAAQVLGGLGVGATLSVGSLLIVEVTGNESLSGLAATTSTLGAAIAGIPLARLAVTRGRRVALSLGNLIAVLGAVLVVTAAVTGTGWLLFAGMACLGVASAVQLQSRFAAADLADRRSRARDLSLVVWSTTVGAVLGPNLVGPGERIGALLGLPELTGVFAFTVVAQLASALTIWLFLRPDPLLLGRELAAANLATGHVPESVAVPLSPERAARVQRLAIAIIALGHAVMVGVMAMTPLHLMHGGHGVTVIGLTISLHIAGMYALSPVFGSLTGRFGAVPVVLGGGAVLLAAVACTGLWGHSSTIVQLGLILLGLGWSAVTVAGAALLTGVTPHESRTRRQGQSDTTMNLAGAAAGAGAGLLFAAGGFSLVSGVAALILILLVVFIIRVRVLTRAQVLR
ncbi:MFS transporter, partial [Leucobacter sp. M11]|uniref:MFS transporter n=1 Tax=Leucobacter sp. M11 TaxID=2993565 RepID=UPI002D7FD142